MKTAVWQQLPLADPAAYAMPEFDYPDDPLWRSAKISGVVERLDSDEFNASPEELRAYLGLLTGEAEATYILQEWNGNIQGAEETILNGDDQ